VGWVGEGEREVGLGWVQGHDAAGEVELEGDFGGRWWGGRDGLAAHPAFGRGGLGRCDAEGDLGARFLGGRWGGKVVGWGCGSGALAECRRHVE
jgi:hypothetical protein